MRKKKFVLANGFAWFPKAGIVYISLERLWVGESMMTSWVGLAGAGLLWRADSWLIKALNSLWLWTGLPRRPVLLADEPLLVLLLEADEGRGKLRASRNACRAGSKSPAEASSGCWRAEAPWCDADIPSESETRGRGPIRIWWRGWDAPEPGTLLPVRNAINSSRLMFRPRRFLAQANISLALRWYPAWMPSSELRLKASVDSRISK